MTITVHKPELEALIRERLETGSHEDIEDILIHALQSSRSREPSAPRQPRKNLARFLLESPLCGSGLKLERQRDYPHPLDL